MTELDRILCRQAPYIAVLVGPPGVGKTQLAAEWVYRNEPRFRYVLWTGPDAGPADHPHVTADFQGEDRPVGPVELTVVDGLCDPAELDDYLPDGGEGHVLVTATGSVGDWEGWAEVVPVDAWSRAEAIAHLQASAHRLTREDASRVAAAVGDLPQALDHAAQWLEQGGAAEEFVEELHHHPREALGGAGPDRYHGSLADRLDRVRDRLAGTDRWLGDILDAFALLGPDPLPIQAIRPGVLCRSSDLVHGVDASLHTSELLRALPALVRTGLATLDQGLLRVSTVYCAAVRGLSSPHQCHSAERWADLLLKAVEPGRSSDRHRGRQQWSPVLPLFLNRDPEDAVTHEGLSALHSAYGHMVERGRWSAVRARLESLHRRAVHLLAAGAPLVWEIGELLLRVYTDAHLYADALALGKDLWERRTGQYGPGHAATLRSASALLVPLASCGRLAAATELAERTQREQESLVGVDGTDALLTGSRRIVIDRLDGRPLDAVSRGEQVLARQRSQLGEAHTHTLATAYALGRAYDATFVQAASAVELFSRTLPLQEDVLGARHPATIRTVAALELAHERAYGAVNDAGRCADVLRLLRMEFGPCDDDVTRLHSLVTLEPGT
ncbi:tetratricopeptide repeat protein [Streptomyces sp. NPDC046887]|uniref:tetratricopeptide repeat protein n=1 Tax=Streptomyces sp. NPDC046887 TaxID=3155472 RepID=UPI0033CC9C54